MPGITGLFFHKFNIEVSASFLQRLTLTLKHFDDYKINSKILFDANAATLFINRANSNANNCAGYLENSDFFAGIHGEFYGDKFNKISTTTDKLNYILTEYLKNKNFDFLTDLNGKFYAFIFEKKTKKIMLFNDRYALMPVYYFYQNGVFMFSTELKALLLFPDLRIKLDENSILDFFTFEYILADRTFIKDIFMLPAATVLTIAAGQKTLKSYWDFKFSENLIFNDFNDYISEHHRILNLSVNDRISETDKLGMFLSAGLDSRLIAAHIRKSVKHYDTFTFNSSKKLLDAKLAEKISEILGNNSNHFFQLTDDLYRKYSDTFCLLSDGQSTRSAYFIYFCEMIKKFNITNLIIGHYGDNIHGSHIVDNGLLPDNQNYLAEMCKYILRTQSVKSNSAEIRWLFNDFYFKNYYDIIYSNIKDTIAHLVDCKNWNISNYFEMQQRQRRLSAYTFDICDFYFETKYPYTDYRLVDFCLQLPYNILFEQKIQRYSLAINFPKLNEVIWPYTRTRPVENSALKSKFYPKLNQLDVVLKRLIEILSIGKLTFVPAAFEGPEDHWLRTAENIEYINQLFFKSKDVLLDYFNPNSIKKMFDWHNSGRKNYGRLIFCLITFALWLSQLGDASEKLKKNR